MFNHSFLDIYYMLSPIFICFRMFLSLPLMLFGEKKLVKSIKLLPLRIKLINSIQLNHKFVSQNVCYDVFELISFGMCSTQKLSKYVTVSLESSYTVCILGNCVQYNPISANINILISIYYICSILYFTVKLCFR